MSRRNLLIPAGIAALGIAAGILAERVIVGRQVRYDPDAEEDFGALRGQTVTVIADDGVGLHVEIDDFRAPSVSDDLTVIFSHGYSLNQDSWHFQRRDLRPFARLVFADQRAHGKSKKGDRTRSNVDQLGFDLGRIVDEVGGDGPIVLVGHSMGGMSVMALAAHRPELFTDGPIAGVALLATTAGGLSESPFGMPAPVGKALHRIAPSVVDAALAQGDLIEFGRRYGNDLGLWLTKKYSFGSNVSPALTNFTSEMINATPIEVIAEFLPGLEAHEKADALAAMTGIESLVMVGDKDLLTPPSHSAAIIQRMPGAEFELLADTGHMLMLERFPEVNYALRELISRVRRNAADAAVSN